MYESPKNFVPKFFDNTSASYDKVVEYCTFGKDKYWKNKILGHIQNGESFLDLACGTGILTRKIAEKFPDGSIIGIDITKSYLELAKKNSSSNKNISFLHQDVERINLSKKFDCITGSYLPKYCKPTVLVKRCIEHLNPDGKIILHDFTYPKNSLVRALWEMYFVVLNFVGFFSPSWKEAFVKLPKLIKSSKWLDTYENEMKQNGFEVIRINLTWNSSAILVAKNTLEK
jgi:demethylmenaquinone methyltransferase / 2-methoxy-6-polyprenyl-1,4-benzoquinol methylase